MIFFILVAIFPHYAFPGSASQHALSPAVFISAKTLLSELSEEHDIVMVDVRSEKEFEECNIPDSINIPLYSVKVKSFLKNKKLVLINNGFNLVSLKEAGEELNRKGYSIRILYGGLLAWRNAGGKLSGDPLSIKNIDLVNAEDMFMEINGDNENLLLMNLVFPSEETSQIENQNIISVPVRDSKDILIMFNDLLKKKKATPYLSVLIANRDGNQYEKVAHILKGYKDKNIFYLKDGIESYHTFLGKQVMMKNRSKVSSIKQDECSSCSE